MTASHCVAPAKINLYLHLCGRRDDGYHLLDSLVAFVDCIHDRITIEPADRFSFSVGGPFGHCFSDAESGSDTQSKNLVVRAAMMIAAATGRDPAIRIHLEKNLPLASGIGGGSADAAAVVRGLLHHWDIASLPELPEILLKLGADVPVCYAGRPAHMRGIGEIITPAPPLPTMPILLVNPGVACPTAEVFCRHKKTWRAEGTLPPRFDHSDALIAFLNTTGNDLQQAAIEYAPIIADALAEIGAHQGCRLTRMSGSGATLFALFDNNTARDTAAQSLTATHPDWWVRGGAL